MDTKEFSFPKDVVDESDLICLFGFRFKEIESFLGSTGKEVVCIGEPDFGVFSSPFKHQIHQVSDLESFHNLMEAKVFLKVSYVLSPFLTPEKQKKMELLKSKCQEIEWSIHLEASDYQDFGVQVFCNLVKNYVKQTDKKSFFQMKGALQNIPAILCGAGPSLKISLPYLEKMQKRAVVFAGGAALEGLSSHGVSIDIAAGIDPDSSIERCLLQGNVDAPFFYQTRVSSALLDKMEGPLFEVPSTLDALFENSIQAFDAGPTVTTFCLALAIYFGCNPIVFAGMDLAYSEKGDKYFQEIEKNDVESKTIQVEDALTQKDWVIAARWLEHVIEKSAQVEFYTTSEKGLLIQGLEKVVWKDLLQDRRFTPRDIEGAVHTLKALTQIDDQSLQERKALVETVENSLKESLAIVEKILFLFQEEYPKDPKDNSKFILLLFTLYNEIVYQKILEPLWKVWQYPLGRAAAQDYAKHLNKWLFFKRVLQEYLS